MALNSYLDFAEDDYKYFMDSYNSGLIANSMGKGVTEMDKETILNTSEIQRRSRKIFCNMEFVKKVYLFGSYARNEAKEKSDIDFLIETNCDVGLEFFGLYDYLQDEFQKRVDVITKEEAERIMKNGLEKDKVLIYER